jgi:amidase
MLGIWKNGKGRTIDAFIAPVAPHPVPETDRWNGVGYTSTFVLLDYPAGTLPVRDLAEDDLKDKIPPDVKVLGGWDAKNRELCKPDLLHFSILSFSIYQSIHPS